VIAANELRFVEAVKLLQNYSMIERLEDLKSYTMHAVVHRWASHMQDNNQREKFMQLAMMVVGYSVPEDTAKEYWILQRRLLPHANSCLYWIMEFESFFRREGQFDKESTEVNNIRVGLDASSWLGYLYNCQGKLKEAEEMYQHALRGCEKALGQDHTSTLNTVNNLGNLYADQGKLKEAEEMYQPALKGKEKALGLDHTSTLDTVNNLGSLYADQGNPKEAEEMYQRALKGYEKTVGSSHQKYKLVVQAIHSLQSQGNISRSISSYIRLDTY